MDLKHAKELLIEERDRLQQLEGQVEESGDLDETQRESSGALAGHDQHPGDAATQTFQRQRDVSIEESLQLKLEEISDALDRVESGEYGRCEVCGEEISDERLTALPATRFCAEHASEIQEETPTAEGGWSVTQELGPDEA